MRLSVRISPVEPGVYKLPQRCPHRNCDGKHFEKHQDHCAKAIRDPKYEAVEAKRYYCPSCERTFRVYPKGVSSAAMVAPPWPYPLARPPTGCEHRTCKAYNQACFTTHVPSR